MGFDSSTEQDVANHRTFPIATMLKIDVFILGPLEVNTYVIRSNGDCWVVDPAGLDGAQLLKFLRDCGSAPSRVLLTHGHADHVAGIPDVKMEFPSCKVCCPAADAGMLTDADSNLSALMGVPLTVNPADEILSPGHVLTLGSYSWVVLDTSGHTPGGVSYYCREAKVVLTGDALFDGNIGRTDIPGGHLGRLVKHIRVNLMNLPDDTRTLPGHGPESTIGCQRASNPYLKDFHKSRPVSGR